MRDADIGATLTASWGCAPNPRGRSAGTPVVRGVTRVAPRAALGLYGKARRGSESGILDRGATQSRRDSAPLECRGAYAAGCRPHSAPARRAGARPGRGRPSQTSTTTSLRAAARPNVTVRSGFGRGRSRQAYQTAGEALVLLLSLDFSRILHHVCLFRRRRHRRRRVRRLDRAAAPPERPVGRPARCVRRRQQPFELRRRIARHAHRVWLPGDLLGMGAALVPRLAGAISGLASGALHADRGPVDVPSR